MIHPEEYGHFARGTVKVPGRNALGGHYARRDEEFVARREGSKILDNWNGNLPHLLVLVKNSHIRLMCDAERVLKERYAERLGHWPRVVTYVNGRLCVNQSDLGSEVITNVGPHNRVRA